MDDPITNHLAPNVTVSEADSVVPRFDWQDEDKRKYLSYRLCGFSRAECTTAAGVTSRTVRNWLRDDKSFYDIEHRDLLELRKEFAKEIVGLDFSRNMKLAMEVDRQILEAAVSNRILMSKEDREYLKAIRPLYSAQHMKILEEMFHDNTNDQGFDSLIILAKKTYNATTETQGQGSADFTQREQAEYLEGATVESWLEGREEEA